jgi:hypothetical protein
LPVEPLDFQPQKVWVPGHTAGGRAGPAIYVNDSGVDLVALQRVAMRKVGDDGRLDEVPRVVGAAAGRLDEVPRVVGAAAARGEAAFAAHALVLVPADPDRLSQTRPPRCR